MSRKGIESDAVRAFGVRTGRSGPRWSTSLSLARFKPAAIVLSLIAAACIGWCAMPESSGQDMSRASREELRQVVNDTDAHPQIRQAALEQLFVRAKGDIELIKEAELVGDSASGHASLFRRHLLEQLQD